MEKVDILQHQILRLAKIHTSKKVTVNSIEWHIRVANIQVKVIKEIKNLISANRLYNSAKQQFINEQKRYDLF